MIGTQGGNASAPVAQPCKCSRYGGSVPGGGTQQRPQGDKPKGIGAGGSNLK